MHSNVVVDGFGIKWIKCPVMTRSDPWHLNKKERLELEQLCVDSEHRSLENNSGRQTMRLLKTHCPWGNNSR